MGKFPSVGEPGAQERLKNKWDNQTLGLSPCNRLLWVSSPLGPGPTTCSLEEGKPQQLTTCGQGLTRGKESDGDRETVVLPKDKALHPGREEQREKAECLGDLGKVSVYFNSGWLLLCLT